MRKVVGGKNIYGFPIGVMMLQSRFPRIPGDMGNAHTWGFPVLYKVIPEASPDAVVRKGNRTLLENFIRGAKELEQEGVRAITTNCGFLAMFQKELAAEVSIPVFTSSLMQLPMIKTMLTPDQKVGVVTIYSKNLTRAHLESVGAAEVPMVVYGTEDLEEFSRVILGDENVLDVAKSRSELVEVTERVKNENPDVGAILLECTNMTPFAQAIQDQVGLPVFDIYTLVHWVHQAVDRRGFTGIM